ncbi:S9 family peptidase [Pseudoalteromonas umbrosa]|uniref:S9 family peptidase n=1 Tax=Pseudoalteromonas umbrosa TaxID=3048489 RepID=UPI0024C37A6A|nr:prolyl oligopeptidase family serine peptidase [Pseudoalteromonas sp. B95]MDK1287656.1 prolyl oligopeptidase family serine peptidase [Pseudoalteromonas sp. B95]
MIIIRALILFVSACMLSSIGYADASTYKQPSAEMAELIQHHSVPEALVNSQGSWMALLTEQTGAHSNTSTSNLLGVHFNTATNLHTDLPRYSSLSFKHIDTGAVLNVTGIPQGNIVHPTWSANGRYLAFVLETTTSAHLWIYDIKRRKPKSLSSFALNGFAINKPFEWLADGSGLIANFRVNLSHNKVRHEVTPDTGTGPLVVTSTAKIAKVDDEGFSAAKQSQFMQFALGQLYKVPLNGKAVAIGQPAYFSEFKSSPDSTNLIVAMIDVQNLADMSEQDFDNQSFSVWQIWGMRGVPLYEVFRPKSTLSEQDILSQPFIDSTLKRGFQWRADKGATLVWAQSEPDDDNESLYSISAPFRRDPRLYTDVEGRVSEIIWGDNQLALMVIESDQGKKSYYSFSPLTPERAKVRLSLFDDMGTGEQRELVMTKNELGVPVVKVAGGRYLFLKGTKKRDGVDVPYLARFDARGNLITPIWQSSTPYFEQVIAVLADDGMQFVTRKESKENPANYFSRNLTFDVVEQLTKYAHPYPSMQPIRKEEMQFKVGAGKVIKGDFYLPNSFDPSLGRIPLVIWLNNGEQNKANQEIDSPYLFPELNAMNGVPFVHEGYAVLNLKNMPVLSAKLQGQQLDKQLRDTAKVIIDTLVSQGIADKSKIAIGGHGLAATNVMKLLTQTDMFVTGIARSGTYNLTLAPFIFGDEAQSLWAQQDKYLANSPLYFAQNMKSSVLLMHGYQDRQIGSYPVQSERMFSALNDLGKTARLVLLPNSDHTFSDDKDLLHMLYEQQQWLKLHFEPLPEVEELDQVPEALRFELPSEQEAGFEYPSPWG